jgi:hypothetical protein
VNCTPAIQRTIMPIAQAVEATMRAGWLIAGMLGLVGCASSGDLAHNKPTFQASTAKLDSVYAACVHARWLAISPTARMLETPTTLQVVVGNATTDVEELLVIHSKAMGAEVALYERMQILALRAYRDSAKACL